MNQNNIGVLYDYAQWANGRILKTATKLTPEQFITPVVPTHGSLRAVLVHIVSAEINWRLRCQEGVSPTRGLAEADFASLDEVATRWQQEAARMRAYIAGLTDEDLQQRIAYRTTKGEPQEHSLWQILSHVINHGTQHRAEAGMILTEYGASPGDLDLIVYLREWK